MIRLPANRKKDTDDQIITPHDLAHRLLPEVPDRYRPLVALAGGTGLRSGECAGLRWDALDLDVGTVSVVRVAVEVAGTVTIKPFPKSKASRRTVPLSATVIAMLAAHREAYPSGRAGEVFTNTAGGPLRRTLFRSRVWRPALASAGLLGRIEAHGKRWRASYVDTDGQMHRADVATRPAAVAWVAEHAPGRAAVPRSPPLVRHTPGLVRGTGQRRAEGDGARAGVDHAQPLHPRIDRPGLTGPGSA